MALEVCDGINWSVECELAVAFCQATQFAPVMAAIPGTNVYGEVVTGWEAISPLKFGDFVAVAHTIRAADGSLFTPLSLRLPQRVRWAALLRFLADGEVLEPALGPEGAGRGR